MGNFIGFITSCIGRLVNVLSFKPFPDMPITYFELLLGVAAIPFIIKFIFGGFKEVEHNTNVNYMNFFKNNKASKDISNIDRKNQINGYIPKHSKKEYVPKHSSK